MAVERILDVGSPGSQHPVMLVCLGSDVWTIDVRKYEYAGSNKNLHSVIGDIRKTSFSNGSFDIVTAVLTIKPIGLARAIDSACYSLYTERGFDANMRICFLGLEMAPLDGKGIFVGGTVNNVIRLSKKMSSFGHTICIVTSDLNRRSPKKLQAPWGTIYTVPIYCRYGSLMYALETAIKLLYKMMRINAQEKFEIINIHSGYSSLAILAFAISFFVRAPIVFSLYSVAEGTPSFGRVGNRFLPILEKVFFSRVRRIIAVSENVKTALEAGGFHSGKILCIPPAVDMEQFNPLLSMYKSRQELAIDQKSYVILYVGSWNPDKGVEALVDGFRNLSCDFPQVKLVLAWGGIEQNDYERARLRKKIRLLGLNSRIIELGITCKVAELMTASNVVVVPYLTTRGIADKPLTVIEAMACGRPVVATNVGGIKEIIKDGFNGILVNPGQPSEIEKGLRFVISNRKESEKIGINAVELVSKEYDINKVATMVERVFIELLDA